jgi:hypothetical protein
MIVILAGSFRASVFPSTTRTFNYAAVAIKSPAGVEGKAPCAPGARRERISAYNIELLERETIDWISIVRAQSRPVSCLFSSLRCDSGLGKAVA